MPVKKKDSNDRNSNKMVTCVIKSNIWEPQVKYRNRVSGIGGEELRNKSIAQEFTSQKKNLSGLIFLHHCLLGNQEISAFGKNGEGDSGDHWKVICSNTFWERDQAVRLKHVDTET